MKTRTENFGDSTLVFLTEEETEKQIGIIEKDKRNYSAHLIGYGDIHNGKTPYFSTSNQAVEAVIYRYQQENEMEEDREFISLEEALELNKTESVGFYFENEESTSEVWFPEMSLWNEPIGHSMPKGISLADLKNESWVKE